MDKQFIIPDWSDKTVLIAEDVDANFMVLTALLKKTEIHIIRAITGEEAVKLMAETPDIDVILMDISMPVMDGVEATRLIRQQFPEKPIIAQTAHALPIQRDRITQEGCNDVLLKPIRRNILIETISKYIN